MRVAYVTHYSELLGANRSLLDLVLELRARGAVDPVVVLPREGPLSERLAKENVPFTVFPFQPWMSERHYMGGVHHRFGQWRRYERAAAERRRTNEALLPEIAAWMKEQRIELIHLNSAAVGIAPGMKRATADKSGQAGLPLVWHIRELPERQYLLHIDRGRAKYGQVLREADRLIAISEAVKEDIVRYTGNIPAELIYNGVLRQQRYAELKATAAERWMHPSPFTFALVGLIHPSKGQEEAIRAIDKLRKSRPDVKLVIGGNGKDEHLRKLIAELGVGAHVELRGYVDDPFAVFSHAHACLMCSRNEAMGRVTVEAMAAGLPVVGHASGGTLELIQDGVNGLRYTTLDELVDRMLALVNDPAKARALGEKAMALAAERFSVERMAEEIARVYDGLRAAQ